MGDYNGVLHRRSVFGVGVWGISGDECRRLCPLTGMEYVKSSYISKSKFEVSQNVSASPSPGFGLSWQTKVVTEICLELGYEVVNGVGGHTRCLRDGICLEL